VDFTIEVERALRVLDGAVLVLCSVGGVQSQSITVDRQMRRYSVPRVAFINKLDRSGADPWKVIDQVRRKLKHNCAAIQYPIGLEDQLQGLVDLVQNRAFFFHGVHGEKVTEADMPNDIVPAVAEKRRELIEAISEVDEELADLFLNDHPITPDELAVCTNLCTISSFSPL
jgi:elongation factor G